MAKFLKPMRLKQFFLIAALLFACTAQQFIAVSAARSQDTLNIAAIVNDDVISVYDLSQRILMVITFSQIPNTPQNQQRIAPDVLRRLIIEKLRMQEAKRLQIEAPESEIQRSIAEIEKRNNIPPGQMNAALERVGIDPESLRQQVIADIVWGDIVRSLFSRLVSVSDQEVEDVLAKMRADAGKPEYHVAEIFLAYDEKPRSEVEQVAQRIHAQLGAGASWPQMAQNFSESASAVNGGDLGWNLASDLGAVLGGVVSRLEPGQMSSPITTDDGVYILLLRNKRIAKGIEASPEDITLGIHQLHLTIPQNADPKTITDTTMQATQLAQSAENCDAFSRISKSEGSEHSGFLGKFKLDQLNPQLKAMVRSLNVDQASQPLRTADGVIVLMVCSRESGGQEDPIAAARGNIRLRILNRRIARMAAQHEDKLRRQAFIDIRL
ncbi:peptidylprolyl isomerase [Thalassospiraceae bacterium LMO-JJ14]|nr:peptidylprolyl isomerase [Thalassospiraceae bacterium LMO-JJ14]